MLHAFQGLQSEHEAHLVIVGHVSETSTGYQAELQRLSAALGIADRIHWRPDVHDAVVPEYLLAADLYVVPFDDGLSTRRTSAMAGFACGLPVVSTRGEATAKVFVSGENVELVPPGDSDVLCATLVDLLRAPERRAVLSSGALTVALQFTWATIARQLTSVFETVAAGNKPRASVSD